MPTEGYRSWSACRIETGEEMIDVTNPYIDAGSDVVLPLESVDGEQLMVQPNESHQIISVWQSRDIGTEEGRYDLSAYCRPRYLTI